MVDQTDSVVTCHHRAVMRRYRHGRCAGRSPETGAYRAVLGQLDKRKATTVSIEEVSKLSPSLSLGAAQMLPGYGT